MAEQRIIDVVGNASFGEFMAKIRDVTKNKIIVSISHSVSHDENLRETFRAIIVYAI
jgi:N-acetylglucosamine-6-phosphate deacetylase